MNQEFSLIKWDSVHILIHCFKKKTMKNKLNHNHKQHRQINHYKYDSFSSSNIQYHLVLLIVNWLQLKSEIKLENCILVRQISSLCLMIWLSVLSYCYYCCSFKHISYRKNLPFFVFWYIRNIIILVFALQS